MGRTNGLGGVAALGVEQMKPYITRGVLIDIARFKQVPTLPPAYEVTLADVRGALARQRMSETSIGQGEAVLFNFGWAVNWTILRSTTIRSSGPGENRGSPGIGVEVANWLIERKVGLVGGDSCCVEFAARCRRRASTTCSSSATGSVAREPRSRRARARRGKRVPFLGYLNGSGEPRVVDSPIAVREIRRGRACASAVDIARTATASAGRRFDCRGTSPPRARRRPRRAPCRR